MTDPKAPPPSDAPRRGTSRGARPTRPALTRPTPPDEDAPTTHRQIPGTRTPPLDRTDKPTRSPRLRQDPNAAARAPARAGPASEAKSAASPRTVTSPPTPAARAGLVAGGLGRRPFEKR